MLRVILWWSGVSVCFWESIQSCHVYLDRCSWKVKNFIFWWSRLPFRALESSLDLIRPVQCFHSLEWCWEQSLLWDLSCVPFSQEENVDYRWNSPELKAKNLRCYKDFLIEYLEFVLFVTLDVSIHRRGESNHWKQNGENAMGTVDDHTSSVTRSRKAVHMVGPSARLCRHTLDTTSIGI